MIETKHRWKSVRDREKWAARGASFVGKVKATKIVWFPPKPVETGRKAASTAEEETTKAAKKTTDGAGNVVAAGSRPQKDSDTTSD